MTATKTAPEWTVEELAELAAQQPHPRVRPDSVLEVGPIHQAHF
ncbi:hypothetical protein [Streptomyces sp. MAA16]|nr:hypothetical protein [Streptomyces sp. MAA16]MDH6698948.1 hypothetical protein [Streptomyces sp. MAA16]